MNLADFGIVKPHASPRYFLGRQFTPSQHFLKHKHHV